jgi:hypothetical protein
MSGAGMKRLFNTIEAVATLRQRASQDLDLRLNLKYSKAPLLLTASCIDELPAESDILILMRLSIH